MHNPAPSQDPYYKHYLSSLSQTLSTFSRGTFKFGLCTVGCYIGSALAGNLCLLYAPALLNSLGYQVATSAGLGFFGAWASGQATLTVSYYQIDSTARALGGAAGTFIGAATADILLFALDQTIQLISRISERIFSANKSSEPSVQIV